MNYKIKYIFPFLLDGLNRLLVASFNYFAICRLAMVCSREGHMISILSTVNVHRKTPMAAIIFEVCSLSFIFLELHIYVKSR